MQNSFIVFLSYKKKKNAKPINKRKAKQRIVIKEFDDELLNLVTIQHEIVVE